MKRAGMLLLAVALAGCGVGPSAGGASPMPAAVSGSIEVFAAASLTSAFNAEATAFTALHPGASVQFNFAGSSTLAAQLGQGASADVFASADAANMQKAVTAGDISGTPRVLARNLLEIVVAAGNPKRVQTLADLANPGTVVVLCAPAVPCGNYAQQALARAGVAVTPKSQELDVKGVVSKVSLGEADAGIVYVTDVKAAGNTVTGVPIPAADNIVATYPIAAVKGGSNPTGGAAFIQFVLSPAGQKILRDHGFSGP